MSEQQTHRGNLVINLKHVLWMNSKSFIVTILSILRKLLRLVSYQAFLYAALISIGFLGREIRIEQAESYYSGIHKTILNLFI